MTKTRSEYVGYLGFLDGRPHVQQIDEARSMTLYVSRTAARRAYEDVRRVRVIVERDRPPARRRGV